MTGQSDKLDSGLISFIKAHIDSVEQLEVLLLMRNDPAKAWSAQDVSRQLRSSAASASHRLEKLCALRLIIKVDQSDSYRYEPSSPELRDKVTALSEAYLVRRVTVIDLIFSNPVEKIKTLADAFKLRGDK